MSVTNTERRRRNAVLAACAAALIALLPHTAAAHPVTPKALRELVRIQGHRLDGSTPAPAGARDVTFTALGQQVRFRATEWRIFHVAEPPATPLPERSELTLQGDRSALLAITRARPDQRVTILAERRPGAGDLFLLAVDRCPE